MSIFVFTIGKVPSQSMTPTILTGDQVLIIKLGYFSLHSIPVIGSRLPEIPAIHARKLKRGLPITFSMRERPGTIIAKRIIGLPGDVIQFDNDSLYVNGMCAFDANIDHYKWYVTRRDAVSPSFVKKYYCNTQGITMPFFIHEQVKALQCRSYNNGTAYISTSIHGTNTLPAGTRTVKVPKGYVFVYGDNIKGSSGSEHTDLIGYDPHRQNNFVPINRIIGTPFMVICSTATYHADHSWLMWICQLPFLIVMDIYRIRCERFFKLIK